MTLPIKVVHPATGAGGTQSTMLPLRVATRNVRALPPFCACRSSLIYMIAALAQAAVLANGLFMKNSGFEFNLALIGLLTPVLLLGPGAWAAGRVAALETQRRQLEKELSEAKRQLAMGGGGGAAAGPEEIAGVKVMARVMDGVGGKDLRPIAEEFKKQLPDGVILLIGTADGKAAISVAVTGSAQGSNNAAEIAKAGVLAMGGQGAGGRPDFAQGGAPDAAKADDGMAAAKAAIR